MPQKVKVERGKITTSKQMTEEKKGLRESDK